MPGDLGKRRRDSHPSTDFLDSFCSGAAGAAISATRSARRRLAATRMMAAVAVITVGADVAAMTPAVLPTSTLPRYTSSRTVPGSRTATHTLTRSDVTRLSAGPQSSSGNVPTEFPSPG